MRRQRNRAQMKEQDKTLEKELCKMETRNLPDAEFKTLVIRVLNELRGRVDDLSKNFNKELGNIKKEDRKHNKEPVRNKECNN